MEKSILKIKELNLNKYQNEKSRKFKKIKRFIKRH